MEKQINWNLLNIDPEKKSNFFLTVSKRIYLFVILTLLAYLKLNNIIKIDIYITSLIFFIFLPMITLHFLKDTLVEYLSSQHRANIKKYVQKNQFLILYNKSKLKVKGRISNIKNKERNNAYKKYKLLSRLVEKYL